MSERVGVALSTTSISSSTVKTCPIHYIPDENVGLDGRKVTLRTALKESPDQIRATAALWRERGLEPSFYDAGQILQLRNTMAFLEYAEALQAFAFAGTHATTLQRGALSNADIQLERFGLTNTPKRIAIMDGDLVPQPHFDRFGRRERH